jgi:primosomal protein N' (replication factor Y)
MMSFMNSSTRKHFEVAVACPLEKSFTYYSEEAGIQAGSRVLIPFSSKKLIGVVVREIENLEEDVKTSFKIKSILKKLEEEDLMTHELLELGKWLSSYYHTPLGEVYKAMIPQREVARLVKTWTLSKMPEDLEAAETLKKIFGQKKTVLTYTTVQKKYKELLQADPNLPPLEFFKKKKWVIESKEEKKKQSSSCTKKEKISFLDNKSCVDKPTLTEEQEEVYNSFFQKSKEPWKPFLLQGVTGSGKTEVYLRILERILEEHKTSECPAQALVLVPEISLTPQMTKVFKTRFPNQVSVLHSALPEKERYEEILKIFHGKTQILIGARSSVFAPFKNLKLIVIDEEHDTSYKQSTQFTYHARDTALIRAQRKKIPILLGSATPSVESFWNARSQKFHHLKLTKRVHTGILPHVELVEVSGDSKGEKLFPGFFGRDIEKRLEKMSLVEDSILEALRENLEQKKQSIVIVNRRGYAYYLLDLTTKKTLRCTECSVSMTLHNQMKILTCHYCDRSFATEELLKNPDKIYAAIGFGSQKIELFLENKIKGARVVRLDSDVARKREELTKTLDDFRNGEIDILVGTQILAKGHDFPKVTLVALLEVDEQLNLPDFRAGERTFQLLVQAAGRAGRSEDKGVVYLQTTKGNHKLILDATHHNYDAFIEDELKFRKDYSYPPFYKMVLLEFSCLDRSLLENFTSQLSFWLENYLEKNFQTDIRLQGPYSPGIERINKRWRKHFLLRSEEAKDLHKIVSFIKINNQKMPGSIRFKIDVDPQNML